MKDVKIRQAEDRIRRLRNDMRVCEIHEVQRLTAEMDSAKAGLLQLKVQDALKRLGVSV